MSDIKQGRGNWRTEKKEKCKEEHDGKKTIYNI